MSDTTPQAESDDRPCHRCGKNPAEGFASVWTLATGDRWYCHGDDDDFPTCYEAAPQVLHDLDDVALEFGVDLRSTPGQHTPTPAAVARATESAAVGGAGLEESV